jgi:hypothetical protein
MPQECSCSRHALRVRRSASRTLLTMRQPHHPHPGEHRRLSQPVRMLLWVLAGAGVLWASAALAWRSTEPEQAAATREQPAVYAAYLASSVAPTKSGAVPSTAVLAVTKCAFRLCTPGDRLAGVSTALKLRLIEVNRRPASLGAIAPDNGSAVVAIQRTRPLRTFSAVAFNRSLDQALFYTEDLCPLCGRAEFVLMRKQNGTWRIAERATTWVS